MPNQGSNEMAKNKNFVFVSGMGKPRLACFPTRTRFRLIC